MRRFVSVLLLLICLFAGSIAQAAPAPLTPVPPRQSSVAPSAQPNTTPSVVAQDLRAQKVIALTFDDGPSSKTTERLLNLLDRYNARVTFFVLGNRLGGNAAACTARAYRSGHEIGNHSYSHPNLKTLSLQEARNEMTRTSDTLEALTGARPRLARTPGGNNRFDLDWPLVLWRVDTEDWKYRNAQRVCNHVLNNAKDGDIILMHDIHATTIDAMELLLPELVARGFTMVTVSELLTRNGDSIESNKSYSRMPYAAHAE